MITIGQPYIEKRGQEVYLLSLIQDEVRQRELEVWYSVDEKYGEYLCSDYADCFLLLVLQLAMNTGQDIRVKSPVSSRLLFNLENTVQPLLAKTSPKFKHIRIEATPATQPHYHAAGVGCCCSLGIDSFASFLKQMAEETPDSYHVTHLTLFNSGQLGYRDVKGTERSFRETVMNLRSFAEEVGLPIVAVNSNLNELYHDGGLTIVQSVVFRTISCAMALQKLFGKYTFASSYPIDKFVMCYEDCSHMESAFVPLLSTENTEVVLSQPTMTRVDKTAYVSRHPITYRYLDVCWAGQMTYGDANFSKFYEEKKNTNCGRCDKCLRTILALDLLGELQKYEGQFDLAFYRSHKDWYIAKVLVGRDSNIYYGELAELLMQKGYVVSGHVKKIMMRMKHPWIDKIYCLIKHIKK